MQYLHDSQRPDVVGGNECRDIRMVFYDIFKLICIQLFEGAREEHPVFRIRNSCFAAVIAEEPVTRVLLNAGPSSPDEIETFMAEGIQAFHCFHDSRFVIDVYGSSGKQVFRCHVNVIDWCRKTPDHRQFLLK